MALGQESSHGVFLGGKKDVGIRGEKKVRQNSDINRLNLKVSKIYRKRLGSHFNLSSALNFITTHMSNNLL